MKFHKGRGFVLFTATAKSLHSCPTLCNPIDGSPSGCAIPGVLQARILEWVAISFSNAWKRKVNMKSISCVWLLVTPWTAAHQAPPSMGFSRQEYWSGVPLPSLLLLQSNYIARYWSLQMFHWINELMDEWGQYRGWGGYGLNERTFVGLYFFVK